MSQGTNKDNKLKGLKLKTLTIILIVVLLVLCSVFIANILNIRKSYEMLTSNYEESVRYHQDAQMLKEGSFYLTEQVHLFVVTGEKKYADAYFIEVNETKRRTNAVNDLRETTTTSAHQSLIDAFDESELLRKSKEVNAIRLVAEAIAEENGMNKDAKAEYLATFDESVVNFILKQKDEILSSEEKRNLAIDIVFDEDYLNSRDTIDSSIQRFLDSTYEVTEQNKKALIASIKSSLLQQSIFIVLILVITASYLICISRLVLKPLKIYMKCVREGRTFELLGAYEFKHLALTYNNIFEVSMKT